MHLTERTLSHKPPVFKLALWMQVNNAKKDQLSKSIFFSRTTVSWVFSVAKNKASSLSSV